MSDDQLQGELPLADPAVVAKASSQGWVPKESYRGTAPWVDAETFVRRGEEILPIVKAENRRLHTRQEALERELREAKEAIEGVKTLSTQIAADRIKADRAALQAEIRAAREAGDVDREEAAREELADLRDKEKQTPTPSKPSASPTAAAMESAFAEWHARPENAWFGVDERKTRMAQVIAQEVRATPAGQALSPTAFLERVAEETEKTFQPAPAPRGQSKSEGGRPSGGGGGRSNGHSYDDLPADAKAACDYQARQFVGKPGYKTAADFQAYYAKIYFADAEERQ